MDTNSLTKVSASAWSEIAVTLKALERSSSITEVADTLARSARGLLAADGATFVVRNGERCHYLAENAVGPLWAGLQFPLSACISGWAMVNGQTAIVEDITRDPRIPQTAYETRFVKSLIMSPTGHDRAEAAIGYYWAEAKTFDEGDILLAEALASAAAPVIAKINSNTMLSREREMRRFAQDYSETGSWEVDARDCTLTGSAVFKSHFGHKLDADFTYRDMMMSFAPHEQKRVQTALRNLMTFGTHLQMTATVCLPDGGTVAVEFVATLEPGAYGQPGHVYGISRLAGIKRG